MSKEKQILNRFCNASVMPKVYYGLHFCDGIAEYSDMGKTVLVNDKVARKMDSTFAGCPVYVNHTEEDVTPENVEEADGYVVESFFNKADGKHWAKFIVVTDLAHEKIAKGWTLSNAYIVESQAMGGTWHGARYDNEIMDARYEHLAIVSNPRYSESIILTPEQFKEYNSKLEAEHERFKNSLGENMKLNIFKKQKMENSDDLAGMSVILPKSKKEYTLETLVNSMDEVLVSESVAKEAKLTDTVKIGDEVITVKELSTRFINAKKKNEELEEEKKENEEDEELENEETDLSNEDEEEMENEEEEEEKKPKNSKKKNSLSTSEKEANFNKLKNANKTVESTQRVIETAKDQISRGQSRYGSGK